MNKGGLGLRRRRRSGVGHHAAVQETGNGFLTVRVHISVADLVSRTAISATARRFTPGGFFYCNRTRRGRAYRGAPEVVSGGGTTLNSGALSTPRLSSLSGSSGRAMG